ncbi:unnamed protein product [Cladocopium goreaui]|uniref:Uncharacterized protein n=1 Tax=Cladocopium goreaui TaxID=2562237 RepID=A0A9P1BL35_9DINO|nr:unnamed protein product [Cladocopium goreaui]
MRQLALKFREIRFENSESKVEASDLRTLVAAHLNLASCYLESEAPDAALKHASTAAQLSGQVLTRTPDSIGDVPAEPTENDFAMLAVSFHKVAEAHEALKEWGKAIFAHTQAREAQDPADNTVSGRCKEQGNSIHRIHRIYMHLQYMFLITIIIITIYPCHMLYIISSVSLRSLTICNMR